MWGLNYCIWTTLVPLLYEGLPIIVLYMQHVKHFKAKDSGQIKEGPEGKNSGYAELMLPLYSNTISNSANLSNMQGTLSGRSKSKSSAEVLSTE